MRLLASSGQHTFSFLIHTPKNVTSERPIALFPSLVRRWEWLIQELKQRTRKKMGRYRRMQRRSTQNGVGSFAGNGKGTTSMWKIGPRSSYFGSGFLQSLTKSALKSNVGFGDALWFPAANSSSTVWILSTSGRVLLEGCVATPLQTVTSILPGSNLSVLFFFELRRKM